MGSKQKYIEDNDVVFVADDDFLTNIKMFTIPQAMDIWGKLEAAVPELPIRIFFSQTVGLVIHDRSGWATFLEIEFLKEDSEFAVMVDIIEVDADNYLDKILLNEYIAPSKRNRGPNNNRKH